jgi:hypothetical protein
LSSVLPAETHDSERNLLPGGHAARLASPVDVPQFGIRFGCNFCHVQGCYFVSLQLSSSFDIYITRNFIICTPHQIKKNELGGACSAYGERRGAYRIWVGRPEGTPRPRWEDNIKVDLGGLGLGSRLDWSGLEHGQVL